MDPPASYSSPMPDLAPAVPALGPALCIAPAQTSPGSTPQAAYTRFPPPIWSGAVLYAGAILDQVGNTIYGTCPKALHVGSVWWHVGELVPIWKFVQGEQKCGSSIRIRCKAPLCL